MDGPQLTPTDHAILEYIRGGRMDADIAARLGLSIGDVKERIERLRAVAAVSERSELARWDAGEFVAPPRSSTSFKAPPGANGGGFARSDMGKTRSDPPPPPPGAEGTTSGPPVTARRGRAMSRRDAIFGAVALLTSGAAGSYFLFGSNGQPSADDTDRPPFGSPTSTPSATTSTPDADPPELNLGSDEWIREVSLQGMSSQADHGIGFMNAESGEVELLRLNVASTGSEIDYMASPGNRFVRGIERQRGPGGDSHVSIYDRRRGVSWTLPSAGLAVAHLEEEYVILRGAPASGQPNGEPWSSYFALDEAMREVARFEAARDAGFTFDPSRGLLFILSERGARQLTFPEENHTSGRTVQLSEPLLDTETATNRRFRSARVIGDTLFIEVEEAIPPDGFRTRYGVGFPLEDQGDTHTPNPNSRFVTHLSVGELSGHLEPSPDGQYLLAGGAYRSAGSWPSADRDWAYADLLTYPGNEPIFRALSVLLHPYPQLDGRRWLGDSSGFVAAIQDPDAPTDDARTWMQGRRFAIIRVDGSIDVLSKVESEEYGLGGADAFPLPSPADPDLFSLGGRAIFNARTGRVLPLPPGIFIERSLDPWGQSSTEMRFMLSRLETTDAPNQVATPLPPPVFERPPYATALAFVVARAEPCVDLLRFPTENSSVVACVGDGTACILAPRATLPAGRGSPPSNVPTAFQWAGRQALVRVRTEIGDEGWLPLQYLDWA